MIDIHGRLTGRARVCLATLVPGATNLITSFADANMDRAPILGIAGEDYVNIEHGPFNVRKPIS